MKQSKTQNLNNFANLLSQHMVETCMPVILKQYDELGLDFTNELYAYVIAKFVGAAVTQALMDRPMLPCGKADLLKHNKDNFTNIKSLIERAVSSGVGGAMREYSGKELEYFCQIKIVPEPLTKTSC